MSEPNLKDTLRAISLSLLLIIFGQTPLIKPFKDMAAAVINPLQYGFYTVGLGVKAQWQFVSTLKSLKEKNFLLEKELDDLKVQLSDYKEIQRENELLKEQLGVAVLPEESLVKGNVIGYGGTQSLIKLDVGTTGGLKKGSVVIYKKFLIGEVIGVSGSSSLVRLITDSQSKISALDQDSPNRARGIVRGEYSTVMIMEKIFQEEEIKVGDTIITSGEDELFPKGLVIGYVSEVQEGEERLLKDAKVTPGVDLGKLEEVFIVR